MKKQISIGITIIACVALCAAVWPRSVEDGKVPAEPVKPAVIAEIEVKQEETPTIILSADNRTSEPELVTAEQTIIIHYRDIGVLGAFAEEAQKISG